jgi:hypothetical protein
MHELSADIPDALRYTFISDSHHYTDSYWQLSRQLRQSGFEMDLSKNSWAQDQYKGLNSRWRSPGGQLLEIQFHTYQSFAGKQLSHGAYERLRSSGATDLERDELYAFQARVCAQVDVPGDAMTIPTARREEIGHA